MRLERFDHTLVFSHGMTRNVHDDLRIDLAQPRKVLFHERRHARVLEPDGVEHARRGLSDARGVVTCPTIQREPFRSDRTKAAHVEELRIFLS